jgi:hypothetical protein
MGCSGSKTGKVSEPEVIDMSANPLVTMEIPEGDFKVRVENTNGDVGLGVLATFPENKYILVEAVKDQGLIPSWNRSHENTPELQVRAGDLIVVVNGVFGTTDLMLAEVKAKTVTLTVKSGQQAPAPPTCTLSAPLAPVAWSPEAAAAVTKVLAAQQQQQPQQQPQPQQQQPQQQEEVPAAEAWTTRALAADSHRAKKTVTEELDEPAAEPPVAAPAVLAVECERTLLSDDGVFCVEPDVAELGPAANEQRICMCML